MTVAPAVVRADPAAEAAEVHVAAVHASVDPVPVVPVGAAEAAVARTAPVVPAAAAVGAAADSGPAAVAQAVAAA